MYVSTLKIGDFRNITSADVELKKGINILYGQNAQGKTNFLESLYICATGRSHRTKFDSQLINFDKKEAHIRAVVEKNFTIDKIDVHIKKEEKKGIALNGVPLKKVGDLFGVLHTVIFSPEDLQLIKSSPGERRKFMDIELCQLSNVYYYNLQQYYKVLKQRNNLLKNINKNPALKDTLFVWDSQLVEYGTKIIKKRQEFIEKINIAASKKHNEITNFKENLVIEYKPNVTTDEFMSKLEENLQKDIILGSTSKGPHKDDVSFTINDSEVKIYGSQGQQRTAALSAKLAEIEIIKEEKGETPVLLLDDVLSELDEKRQYYLLESIKDIQTVITCTGIEDSIKKYTDKSYIFNVENGIIKKLTWYKGEFFIYREVLYLVIFF